jgi:hypothetical protein
MNRELHEGLWPPIAKMSEQNVLRSRRLQKNQVSKVKFVVELPQSAGIDAPPPDGRELLCPRNRGEKNPFFRSRAVLYLVVLGLVP